MITAPAPTSPGGRKTSRQRRSTGWRFVRDVVVIIIVALLASSLIRTFLAQSFYVPSGSMENTLIKQDRVLVNKLVPNIIPLQRGDVIVFKDPGGWLSDPQAQTTDFSNPLGDAVGGLLSEVGVGTHDNNDHLIKRVIGLPGDTVVCCTPSGQTTVNGVTLDEPYTKDTLADTKVIPFSVIVPAGLVWVEGDNRNNSADSRYHLNTNVGAQGLTVGPDEPGIIGGANGSATGTDDGGFVPTYDIVGRALFITWPISRWSVLDDYGATFNSVPDPTG